MSDQEKTSGTVVGTGSLMVVVEQSTASKQKPYRPTILDEAPPDLHHKLSHAPVVPAMSSEKQKHIVAKELSSAIKRPTSPITSPEKITMAALEPKKKSAVSVTPPSQPVPHVGYLVTDTDVCRKSTEEETKGDEDSITEEIAELRTADTTQKVSEWSDDEEAGGLPRSESRGSRVSRAVRQLFCCGVPYEAPSEENVSSPRGTDGI